MEPTHIDKGVRKFILALVGMGLLFAGFVLCKPWAEGRMLFGEFCMAIVSGMSVFSASNVWEKLRKPSP